MSKPKLWFVVFASTYATYVDLGQPCFSAFLAAVKLATRTVRRAQPSGE